MIKTVGLGKKCAGKTREQAQQYHIDNHAPFGRRVAQPLGMKRYVGYYPQVATNIAGEQLADVPWDFIVPEWFTEDFFNNIENWRANDPDGIEITKDEARFCDRASGVMMVCDHNLIVPDSGKPGVNVFFGAKRAAGLTPQDHHEKHRTLIGPWAARVYGSALLDYSAYYIHEAYSLEQGLMAEAPYDVMVQARFDEAAMADMGAWMARPDVVELLAEEAKFMDTKTLVSMVCTYHPYVV
ncbi:MAG: EthD domain-containing protein [Porticoccaceae bacterium]|jgi:hypothetical protein